MGIQIPILENSPDIPHEKLTLIRQNFSQTPSDILPQKNSPGILQHIHAMRNYPRPLPQKIPLLIRPKYFTKKLPLDIPSMNN